MSRICATLILVASISGCGLSHERDWMSHPALPPDASTPSPDVGPIWNEDASLLPRDAGAIAIDAAASPDAGSCTDFWRSLPSCPASTASALGQACDQEGATCGVHCCEPGPPIACTGGHWIAAEPGEDCGPACPPPVQCGSGSCSADRICVRADELVVTGFGTCVLPPAPISSCGAAPLGSLTTDMHTCFACRCSDQPTGPVIDLSCDCCDI